MRAHLQLLEVSPQRMHPSAVRLPEKEESARLIHSASWPKQGDQQKTNEAEVICNMHYHRVHIPLSDVEETLRSAPRVRPRSRKQVIK